MTPKEEKRSSRRRFLRPEILRYATDLRSLTQGSR